MKKLFAITLFSCLAWYQAQAQEVLTLQECIEYAWTNSLRIQQSKLSIEQSKLQIKQADWARYPSLSANIQHGANFGRSIDLTSYQFVNRFMQATSVSLGLNVPIYNGMQLSNTLKRSRVDLQASEMDLQQVKNELSLSIAQAYLSVLLAEENLEVLKEQNLVTIAQYERNEKFIAVGSLPDNSRYELEAQMARNEQSIIDAENNLNLAYLNLKVAINYPMQNEISVQKTAIENLLIAQQSNAPQEIYQAAQRTMPNLQAARMREESALWNVKIAQGALTPSLSAFYNLASNYSSTGTYYTGDTMQMVQTIQGDMNGTPFSLNIPQSIPVSEKSGFFRQMNNNLRHSFGLAAQIPIFNGFRTRISIQQAELSVKIAQLNTQQLEIQLQSDIQKAVLDIKGSEKRLLAAQKSLTATLAAVENTTKRYELGIVNSFEYLSAQNSLLAARSNVLQAQYDYLFKLKILDFYQGKAISL